MSTLSYRNTEFNILYIDPTIGTAGDGSTPASALIDLPADMTTLTEHTAFVIRCTADTAGVNKPTTNPPIGVSFLFIGMPKEFELLYALMPDEVRTAWGADTEDMSVMFKNDNIRVKFDDCVSLVFVNIKFICTGLFSTEYFHLSLWYGTDPFNNTDVKRTSIVYNCITTASIGRLSEQSAEFDNAYYPGLFYNDSNDQDTFGWKMSIEKCDFDHAYTLFNSNTRTGCNILHMLDTIFNSTNGAYVLRGRDGYYSSTDAKVYHQEVRLLNLTQNVFINGNSSSTSAGFFYIARDNYGHVWHSTYYCYVYALNVNNININTDAPVIGTCTLDMSYGCVFDFGASSIHVENIDVNLSKIYTPGWADGYNPRGLAIVKYDGNDDHVDTQEKIVKNISYTLASDGNGIGTIPNLTQPGVSSSAWNNIIALYGVYAENISVDAPRWNALFLQYTTATSPYINGNCNVWSQSTLQADYIRSAYPARFIYAQHRTRLFVEEVVASLDNASDVYIGDPVIYNDYNEGAMVIISKTNAPAFGSDLYTDGDQAWNLRISYNDCGAGNFRMRSNQHILETWNTTRNGHNVLRFAQYKSDQVKWFSSGYYPYKGFQNTPTALGKQTATIFFAHKNHSDLDYLYKNIEFEIRIPSDDTTSKYTTVMINNGMHPFVVDISSTYVNDSDLNQTKVEVPIEVLTLNKPLELVVKCNAYNANGYIYFDPKIELA